MENIENLMGTLNGTCWEQMKSEKIPLPHPPKTQKKKNEGTWSAC
jgi:hypothetical protein